MSHLLRTTFALGAMSALLGGLATPVLAADGVSATRKKCPFEQRTISQVVSATQPNAEFKIAQAQPVEPAKVAAPAVAQATPPATESTEAPAATDAVERVRAIYKQICSRSRQVEVPPTSTPAPVAVPAPIEAPAPVRALW
jgi:type IV secretory pathway VirB10-like protein